MNWIYETSADNTSRFVLGRRSKNPLVCFGINPSTACPECLDQTLKSVERIALKNHYDGWIMLNVYPQRATNPDDLHQDLDNSLHKANLFHIQNILEAFKPDIWASWGTLIGKRGYLIHCLSDIAKIADGCGCNWISCGKLTAKGHPHHPLYLNSQSGFDAFQIGEYLRQE